MGKLPLHIFIASDEYAICRFLNWFFMYTTASVDRLALTDAHDHMTIECES